MEQLTRNIPHPKTRQYIDNIALGRDNERTDLVAYCAFVF
jgi:hypothetical protein